LGVSISDINTTLGAAWGGSYVNDFIDRGRVKKVYVQGEASSRMMPEDLNQWYVRNNRGEMVPFSAFATGEWTYGSPRLERYNGVSAMNIQGTPAPGVSSGDAMRAMEEIIAKLDTDSAAKDAEKLNAKEAFDVLVIGGGPAGNTSAIYAARKGIKTGIVAERMGGQVMDTMDIENFTSVQKTQGPKFAAEMEAHVREYGVDIMNLQRVSDIKGADETANGLVEVTLENGAKLESKTVILSTGARWREMNVPGEAEYKTRGVAYCPHCDGPLFKGKRVAVIGGGNSGVEAAIDLAGIVEHVTLVEFDTKLRADQVLQDKLNSLPNTTVIKNALSTEVVGDGSQVTALKYKDRATDEEHTVELAGIFVQIGLLPNTDFLKETKVELSNRGEIVINERNETNVKGVFAAGDCTTVPYKQIIIATGEGAKASLSAFDYIIRSGQ